MDITHVLCFRDKEAAGAKAETFSRDGYKVVKIIDTDIVICDDDTHKSPKVCNSLEPNDWIVVIATQKKIVSKPGMVDF